MVERVRLIKQTERETRRGTKQTSIQMCDLSMREEAPSTSENVDDTSIAAATSQMAAPSSPRTAHQKRLERKEKSKMRQTMKLLGGLTMDE